MSQINTELPWHDLLEQITPLVPGDSPIYLVGGAIRDMLLGRPTHDLDFVILSENALKISRRIANSIGAFYFPLDEDRATARLILDVNGVKKTLDFAGPRGPDLESDLRARDFTINAMAIDMASPQVLIDPLGGASDLREKVLRVCSQDSLQCDPVRVMRAVRMSVDLQLRILPQTKQLIQQAIPKLATVSVERQRDELFRILELFHPTTAWRVLDRLGVVETVLPELEALKDVEQPLPHRDNVWEHTLSVVQNLVHLLEVLALQHDADISSNWVFGMVSLKLGRFREQLNHHLEKQLVISRSIRSLLIFAALYHDSGKLDTGHIDDDGSLHFYDHESISESIVESRAQQLHLSNAEILRLRKIVSNHMRPLYLANSPALPSRRAIYRFFRDTGEAGVDICLLSLADTLGTYGAGIPENIWQPHLETVKVLLSAYWENNEQQIAPKVLLSGNDLLTEFDLTPGPIIGELLEAIKEAQINGDILNRQQALKFAGDWLGRD
jgi:poly(A) polymerase